MHPRTTRSARAPVAAVVFVLIALAIVLLWHFGRSRAQHAPNVAHGPPREPTHEEQLMRERAAAFAADGKRAQALEALKPLVEREDAEVSDLVHAASIQLSSGDAAAARPLLDRAHELAPDSPEVNYNLGRLLLRYDSKPDEAAEFLRKAHAEAPDDAPTSLMLADAIEQSDPKGAIELYRAVIARGVDQLGSWYVTAVYRLGTQLMREGESEESSRLLQEFKQLQARGLKPPDAINMELGNLGRVAPPPPRGNRPSGTGPLPTFAAATTILPELSGLERAFAADLDGDCHVDLVAWGAQGMAIGLQSAGFAWRAVDVTKEAIDRVLPLDLGNDNDLDLLCARGAQLFVFEAKQDSNAAFVWEPWSKTLPALPSPPSDLLAIDYDHEGDLDLVAVGAFGAKLFRYDGAGPAGTGGFTDVTSEAGLPSTPFAWCLAEDFDTDQDVDLLLGGPERLFLASNLRRGKFEDQSARVAAVGGLAHEPLVADLDGDARPDLWAFENGTAALYLNQPSATLARSERGAIATIPGTNADPGAGADGAGVRALDLDLDGALDVLWPAPQGAHAALEGQIALSFPQQMGCEIGVEGAAPESQVDDLDGDLDWDLWWLGSDGVHVALGGPSTNHATRLAFAGHKDNRRAVGAIVELRAGGVYRRIFWRGAIELAGVGREDAMDYVRVTWPNGVVQYEMRHDLGDRACGQAGYALFQSDGLVGSCPFLYTWDGARFAFVSDVLGITPLGLPIDAEQFVPPDHDEYVLVRGEQLKPKDGVYEMQFTEELREVTYLDRIRLDVVDHPLGTEIFPNELFTFPPFPAPHVHTVKEALAPTAAIDDSGKDWSAALAKIDDDYAAPFAPAPPQFQGLATPHHLELAFDPAKVAAAMKLRLVMTGWFYWTDASVNMASARDPEQEFVPPILAVPDGAGGWKDTGPPIGFPAGKTKTMVIDVTELVRRDDPRLRLFSTLRLYWDSIRLALDDDDAELATHSLEPASAKLWRRGFSYPESSTKPFQPERFDWSTLSWFPRWNQHPGLYTRYGECLPLLGDVDDRFVILGAGDALTVQFDARALPPVKDGFRRDYLVYLDGWAKDRDPNTAEALYVDPLPFHAMSAYPYGANEHFPDDEPHRKWQLEWNTRPAYQWIPLVAGSEIPGTPPPH